MENEDLNPNESLNLHFGKRVLILRQEHNWSLEVLSEKCGVSRSMLSKIERGNVNPTLALTIRIARAFGLGLSELVQDQPEEVTGIHIIRSDDEQYHYRSDKHCRIKTLSPLHLEKEIEFYEMVIHKGAALSNPGHYAGTREFISVTQGQIQVTSDQDCEKLKEGDSAGYRADCPHEIRNIGNKEAKAFLVVIYSGN
jgi:transcriptional regulator with XRE-family HTH domain